MKINYSFAHPDQWLALIPYATPLKMYISVIHLSLFYLIYVTCFVMSRNLQRSSGYPTVCFVGNIRYSMSVFHENNVDTPSQSGYLIHEYLGCVMYSLVFCKAFHVNLTKGGQFLKQLDGYDQVFAKITLCPMRHHEENYRFQLQMMLVGGALFLVTMICDYLVLTG